MSTVLQCPKCGISRNNDDVVITWEHNSQPGVNYSVKKIVRTTIKTEYSLMDEDETIIHTCGMCEYEWSEPVMDAPVLGAVQNDFVASPMPSGTVSSYTFPTFTERSDVEMIGEAHFEFMRHVED